ncbi:MAG TPA: hypothetical protein VHW09_10760 [Bryobacteraceae bacterium]|jgi:hypothetical protein|nr:hypothetical protein [Bryobacteraceae bacterium]
MKIVIVIECDANPAGLPRSLQDFGVLSLSQADLTHVDRIHASFREHNGRAWRQSLIEQNLNHRTGR